MYVVTTIVSLLLRTVTIYHSVTVISDYGVKEMFLLRHVYIFFWSMPLFSFIFSPWLSGRPEHRQS